MRRLLATLFVTLTYIPAATAHLSLIRLGSESANSRETLASFGEALAAADFDGDGFEDLAVGAPNHNNGQPGLLPTGSVTVNFGSNYGLTHEGAVALFLWGPDVNQRFGAALAAGDFNGDGRADLAVGAPWRDDGTTADVGRVFVHEGIVGGISLGPDFDFGPTALGLTPISGDEFGAALTVGRFNADVYDDLAIGIPGRNGGDGLVVVLYGSPAGLSATGAGFYSAVLLGASIPQGAFGAALAAGDQYGGTEDELVIGAPDAVVNGFAAAGRVFVLEGGVAGLSFASPVSIDALHFGLVSGVDANFGAALATGRFFNDQGRLDLAIGEPGFALETGRIVVTHLDTLQQGADQFLALDQSDMGTVADPDERFGAALAAGDTDLDGDDELAVGVPLDDLTGTEDRGFVFLLRRLTTDIGDSKKNLWAKELNSEPQGDGRFGSAVCFGNFDGTGQANLAIGSPGADYKHWDRMAQLGFTTVLQCGQVHIYAPRRPTLDLGGRSAAALNCTDDLVFSQRPFDEVPIASTTKAMTVLLAAEDIMAGVKDPLDTITIDGDKEWIVDFKIGSGETLQKGETITLLNLIRLALCKSSGEACYAIASLLSDEIDPFPATMPDPGFVEPACDSNFPIVQPTFIARMNQRAQQLGMFDTNFTNPHGSRSGSCLGGERHHSTAYDMALLGRSAMENDWMRDLLGEGSYTFDREIGTEFNCGNRIVTQLRSPTRLGARASGVKRGNSGYAEDTGVAAYSNLGLSTAPAIATYFGGEQNEMYTKLSSMLKIADGQCGSVGSGDILPPPPPEPPQPIEVAVGIPIDDGNLPVFGLANLQEFSEAAVELHVERWNSMDASSEATVCFGTVSHRSLAPAEMAQFGIAPFDEHEGFVVRNVGAGSVDLQITTSDPMSSQIITLATNQEYLVPPLVAPGSTSYALTVQNLSSASSHEIFVEELGYCFELSLGLDPRMEEEDFQASLTRDTTGDIEYELLSWEFRGQDTTSGNELAFSANGLGQPTAIDDGPAPQFKPLRVRQYPNPFNPRTTFEYTLNAPGPVRITLFDLRGRVVRRLAVQTQQPAGTHRIIWDGRDGSGRSVASGVYHWRLESAEGSASGRMALIR